jgi:SAM-dependent methyltransferase
MSQESVKDFYNRQYQAHQKGELNCATSLHDLAKAQRRVERVLRGLSIQCGPGAEVLDVGSGLGYYTKALSSTGAKVKGLDFSESAIVAAGARFPDCQFAQGAWPTDVPVGPHFDLIWVVNFSLINTFDLQFIHERLVEEAVRRLKPTGALVIGWNSDLSGRTVEGYSHWPLEMLRRMKKLCGLSAPFVPEARGMAMSWTMIRAARLLHRSIPIFMVRRKTPMAG